MRYRDAQLDDMPSIKRINQQPLHGYDLDTPQFVLAGVVEDDKGEIIGFGGVKVIYECIIILDQTRVKKSRIEALKLLIRNGCALSKRRGIQFWHAYCEPNFGLFLQRWFDYTPAEGMAIVLNTDHGVQNVEARRKEDARTVILGSQLSAERLWSDNQGTSPRASSSQ